jgi:flavin-dependent dehydrogenase
LTRVHDAVVVGGGPAGLAFAAAAARRGLDVVVLERRTGGLDKACGEGILPGGVTALERLGALDRLPAADVHAIREIRWIERCGVAARAVLPAPGGLGVRRTALHAALTALAQEAGAEVLTGVEVTGHARADGRIRAETPRGRFEGRVLVAADGLASPTRRRDGLDRPPRGPRRFGIRRHYAMAPREEAVEVHLGEGVDAYLTPTGPRRMNVALLFEAGAGEPPSFDALLARFPSLSGMLAAAEPESAARGAGPFLQGASARVADRLVLLGDAAGYVDAVSGEGLSLAFRCALDLADLLPEALVRGASREALLPYERAWHRRFRPYAAWSRILLGLTRRPALRRRAVALAASRPALVERLVTAALR